MAWKSLKDTGSEDPSDTQGSEKPVQHPAPWVGFHNSALHLPTQFRHQGSAKLTVPPLPIMGKERGFLLHGGQKWLLALLLHREQKVITVWGSTEKTTINSKTYLSAKTATTLVSLEYFDYSVSEKQLGKLSDQVPNNNTETGIEIL